MKNGEQPAYPVEARAGDHYPGVTKREYACIKLRVPKSGDDELDALIREARCFDVNRMGTEAWKKVMELEFHAGMVMNECGEHDPLTPL